MMTRLIGKVFVYHKSADSRFREGDYPGSVRDRMVDNPYRCIYEMHVRGFTVRESSGVKQPGTFIGVVEKIPYLLSLGITAVELMPVFEFDELSNAPAGLCNYWGYATEYFFVPMGRYGSVQEFKTMVRELHKNNIEVILDVVFNHTGGPCFDVHILCVIFFSSSQVLGRKIYYILSNGKHTNYSGCGNTVCCASPAVAFMIADCLRYWVCEMHVDGFRFDEAPILLRTEDGSVADSSPLLEAMANHPDLKECHFIAESWDAGGAFKLGAFAKEYGWSEWNGKFRDTVRAFIKGNFYFEKCLSLISKRYFWICWHFC